MKEKNKEIKIHCFDTLSDFFEKYMQIVKKYKKSLPKKPDLDKIKEEEVKDSAKNFASPPYASYIPLYPNNLGVNNNSLLYTRYGIEQYKSPINLTNSWISQSLDIANAITQVQYKYCKECFKKANVGDSFCSGCGAKLVQF